MRNAKSDGTVISSFQYNVDDVGNPTGMVLANGDRVTWTYDSLYRLTREQRSGANAFDVTYTFDGAGNRMTKVAGGVTTTYTYGAADALLAENAAGALTTYSYDTAGNTTVAVDGGGMVAPGGATVGLWLGIAGGVVIVLEVAVGFVHITHTLKAAKLDHQEYCRACQGAEQAADPVAGTGRTWTVVVGGARVLCYREAPGLPLRATDPGTGGVEPCSFK